MSQTWMAFIAGLIALEKTPPWRRVATYGTAIVLLTLGVCCWPPPTRSPPSPFPAPAPSR